jgi:hypothetical protein
MWRTVTDALSSLQAIFRALVVQQIGRKPGKKQMKEMFLEREDLPVDNWVKRDIIHRTGVSKNPPPEIVRAKNEKGISGTRVWKTPENQRVIGCGISFFSTESDARGYLPKWIDGIVRKPFSTRQDMVESDIDPEEAPDISYFQILHEKSYQTTRGQISERLVASAVDRVMFGLMFQAADDVWPWDELSAVARRQEEKIRSVFSEMS